MAYNLGYVGTAYNLGYTGTYTGGGVTYPYQLTSHIANPDPNSVLKSANFATTDTPIEFRIISDFDSAKMVVDWQAFSDNQLWGDDINALAAVTVNATSDTTDSATIGWKTPDGTTGQFTATVNITEPAADTTPDQFDLGSNVIGAEPGSTVQRTFVLAGIDPGETVSPSATGNATVSPSTAQAGDTITVELTAGTFEAVVSGGVSINGVSDSFSVTTRAAVVPVQDVALPDLNLGETDPVLIDLDDYFSGAASYSVSGLPAGSGLSFDGTVISGETNKDDIAGSPFTVTVTANSAEGSIQGSFSVTVVDDIAPAVTIGDLTTLNTTPTAAGSAGDATSLSLVVEGVDVTHTSSYNPTPSNGSWAQQLNELAIGTYTMTLTGADDAGNERVVTATLNVVDEIITSPRGLFQPLFRSLTGSVNQTLFR